MEVKFISTKLTCGQNGYGINFKGGSPVLIDTVLPSSPAEHGGLRFGDMLVELNGNDIVSFSKEAVISAIKACNKGTLRVKVGRVRPIPVTAETRKEAVRLVRKKLEFGNNRCSVEVKQYQDKLNNSMAEVDDLLKSFDLPMPMATGPPATAKKSVEGELFQELELLYDDNDSLPSPPSSTTSSEVDLSESDPLLDFSKDDNLTYASSGSKQQKPTATTNSASLQADGSEGPQLMKATMELQRGLQGLKNILQTAERTYEEKETKRRIALDDTPPRQVMTVASFPQSLQRGGGGGGGRDSEGRNTTSAAVTQREKKNIPRSLNTAAREPASDGSSRSKGYGIPDHAVSSPSRREAPHTRKLPSPVRVAPSPVGVTPSPARVALSPVRVAPSPVGVAPSPVRVAPSPARVAPSPARVAPSPTRVAPSPARVAPSPARVAPSPARVAPSPVGVAPSPPYGPGSFPSKARFSPPPSIAPSSIPARTVNSTISTNAAVSRQSSKPHPPIAKPTPYSGSMMSPTTTAPSAQVGSREYISRLESSKKQEAAKEPWGGSRDFERRVQKDRAMQAPPPRHPVMTANIVKVASNGRGSTVGNSRSPSTSPPPPPVPAYNPTQPDSFALSNQHNYVEKQGKLRHSSGEVRQAQEASQVRREREEGGGGVKKLRGSGGQRSFDVQPLAPLPLAKKRIGTKAVVDISSSEASCRGLPDSVTDWEKEEVVEWLQQLSPTLCDLYGDNFTRHDIIGRALLRLNATKLKKMDITSKHSTLLASEIVKLKIRQEKMELEELEPNQLSYL